MKHESSPAPLPLKSCPSGTRQLNVRIPEEMYQYLRQKAPTPKSLGAVITRLLYEDRAREEERQRFAVNHRNN